MMQPSNPTTELTPIIRRARRPRSHFAGGAWKVAMADFALAMMALFMVLWVVNTGTPAQRESISRYFRPADGVANASMGMIPQQPPASPYVIDFGGTPMALQQQLTAAPEQPAAQLNSRDWDDQGDSLDHRRWQPVKQQLEALVYANPTLQQFDHQLVIDVSEEGLRLQLIDRQQTPMFASGGTRLSYLAEDILWELGPILAALPYRLAVIGHTDATPALSKDDDDGNWGLSAGRANSARRALMEAGVPKQQVVYVMGVGDTIPLDAAEPTASVNRRIAIILVTPMENDDQAAVDSEQSASKPPSELSQQLQHHYQTLYDERRQWQLEPAAVQ